MRTAWIGSVAWILSGLTVAGPVDPTCRAEDPTGQYRPRVGFANSGGIYSGGCLDGVAGTLNTFRARPDRDIDDRLRAAREKGFVNLVQLDYDHRWGGDRKDALQTMKRWLERTDLSLVYAVHLSEEQAYNAADWLDPLYDAVKAHDPTLAVYVWPSFPLGPLGKADGYVYDAYGQGYTESRRKMMQFLRTGKPLIMCIDASGYSDQGLAREQLMVCYEFDVPVFYFVADSGSGSYNNWYGKSTAALSACRNFAFSAMEFQRRCRGPDPITAGDLIWGEQIELAPDEEGTISHSWSGFGGATVYGFTRLTIEDGAVKVKDKAEVVLDYQFWSLLPVEVARLHLPVQPNSGQASKTVRVEQSRSGRLDGWQPVEPAHEKNALVYGLSDPGREFRVRITLADSDASPPAQLRGGWLSGRFVLPEDKAIDLDTYYDGWRGKVQFRQDLGVGLWRYMSSVDNPRYLGEGKSLALRGASGHAVSASAVEKFKSKYPLENIVVRLTGMSHAVLGGSFSMGVSLDGKTILEQATPTEKPRADGHYSGAHTLDLGEVPQFHGVREFYVHMNQRNNSGVRGNISSRLNTLQIDAVRGKEGRE